MAPFFKEPTCLQSEPKLNLQLKKKAAGWKTFQNVSTGHSLGLPFSILGQRITKIMIACCRHPVALGYYIPPWGLVGEGTA